MRKPTQPKAPRKPARPIKPKKILAQEVQIYLDMYSDGDTVNLTEILGKLPAGVSAEDVCLRREDDYYGCYECGGSTTINAFYPKEVENEQYDKQLQAYEKKMVKYNEKLELFKERLAEYEIKYNKYIEELKAWEAEDTAKTIAKLEKQLKKLKVS